MQYIISMMVETLSITTSFEPWETEMEMVAFAATQF
jgi:hypothetical protein